MFIAENTGTASTIYESWADTCYKTSAATSMYDEDTCLNWKVKSINAKTSMGSIWCDYGDSTSGDTTPWLEIEYGTNAVTLTAKDVYREINRALNGGWYYRWSQGDCQVITRNPKDQLRRILQKRQAPLAITSRKSMGSTEDVKEIRARETLRRVLGEDKFRRFLKHGFVSVQAKSGLIYQIFPGHGITAVYRDGEMIERLCVVLRGSFPPTDSLIMRYLLILNDERDFRKHAIEHTVYPQKIARPQIVSEPESLNDIWNRIRKVA